MPSIDDVNKALADSATQHTHARRVETERTVMDTLGVSRSEARKLLNDSRDGLNAFRDKVVVVEAQKTKQAREPFHVKTETVKAKLADIQHAAPAPEGKAFAVFSDQVVTQNGAPYFIDVLITGRIEEILP